VTETRAPSLQTALQTEKDHGYRLLAAIENPAESFGFESLPGPEDVARWEAHVKHLLRDDPERLRLFLYLPPVRNPKNKLASQLLDAYVGGPERRRLSQRLVQLKAVIDSL
jgi:hypothetical protein